MRAHVDGIEGSLRFALVAAGGSNLTFRVEDDAGHAWALRRPPVAAVLATAHDMDREWRILDALTRDATVPVPNAIARCDDAEVTGAPFYVMAFVEGVILRTEADADSLTTDEATTATDSLVDVQIAMHALDPDAIGLGTLTRHRTGYVARQLHRWHTQVERGRVRDLPLLDELHDRLVATIPPDSGPASLAHGDYRFDNTVVGPDHHIAAVLDWELCTIGDAVADFAWSLLYWTDPGDPCPFLESAPTLARVRAARRGCGEVRGALGPVARRAAVADGVRLLEDGLHRRRRVRAPAPRRGRGIGRRSGVRSRHGSRRSSPTPPIWPQESADPGATPRRPSGGSDWWA